MILFFIEKTRYFLFYTSVPKRFPFSYAMPRPHSRGSTRGAYVELPKLESPGRGVAAPLLRLPVVTNVYTNIDDVLGSRASQF